MSMCAGITRDGDYYVFRSKSDGVTVLHSGSLLGEALEFHVEVVDDPESQVLISCQKGSRKLSVGR